VSLDWQTTTVPAIPSGVDWKVFTGDDCPHGRRIALVDGTYVRNHFDSDFSQGGNGFRYRFVPRGEIWIDAQISQDEWPLIAFHECQEVELMRQGMSYDKAHNIAKRLEDRIRHASLQVKSP
jgi:hypothetical protein